MPASLSLERSTLVQGGEAIMARRANRNVAGWDPFREFSALQDRMNRLFQDAFGDDFGFGTHEAGATEFTPTADIYDGDNELELRVEIPGVHERDFDISIQDNVLTVKGERWQDKHEKSENFLRQERPYGKFSRSFTLPSSVDPERVNADYVNGVLHIRLAKRAEARPKQIKVSFGQKALQGEAKAA
jgi:HSP20 family protein